MDSINVFVLGLDEANHVQLRAVPDARRYEFHPLLTIAQLQEGDLPIADLLEEARRAAQVLRWPDRCDRGLLGLSGQLDGPDPVRRAWAAECSAARHRHLRAQVLEPAGAAEGDRRAPPVRARRADR